jgi:hypothetical protein
LGKSHEDEEDDQFGSLQKRKTDDEFNEAVEGSQVTDETEQPSYLQEIKMMRKRYSMHRTDTVNPMVDIEVSQSFLKSRMAEDFDLDNGQSTEKLRQDISNGVNRWNYEFEETKNDNFDEDNV